MNLDRLCTDEEAEVNMYMFVKFTDDIAVLPCSLVGAAATK